MAMVENFRIRRRSGDEASAWGIWVAACAASRAFLPVSLIMAVILLVAMAPGALTDRSPTDVDVAAAMQGPSAEHWFGTDETGRDIYARTLYGTRITLSVVAGSLLISAALGGLLGLAAGFFGAWIDMVLARLVDVVLSFPPIILGVVITGVLGPGLQNLVLALSIVYLPVFFRIARSGAVSEANRTYVEAARSIGVPESAIVLRHVRRTCCPWCCCST